jgi:hypothetical protein
MDINNPIDGFVSRRLAALKVIPPDTCTDEVFLRRIYLDLAGILPTVDEARKFYSSRKSDKRSSLISSLLARPEWTDYQAMKWGDLLRVKSEFPIKLWPNAVQAYSRWIRLSLKNGMPFDRFARELLTANGSNFRAGPANFYRALPEKTPAKSAEIVALTFMGTRIASWPAARQAGLSAFFSRIGYKGTSEWKEEIVYFDKMKKISGPAVFPDGTAAKIGPDTDPRVVFADWLLAPGNPWFARNIVNRIWAWMFGRGLIQEPDDIRDDNPPQVPELLAWLEQEFASNAFDLRHIYRIIAESAAYQSSSLPAAASRVNENAWPHYRIRRLEAEVLIDAICAVTGTNEEYFSPIPEPFTFVPWGQRSVLLDDGSISSPFLDMFGRPPRDTGYESERNNDPSVFQVLHLLNSRHILSKIREGGGIRALVSGQSDRGSAIRTVYLAILSRPPLAEEQDSVISYIDRNRLDLTEAMFDLSWALFNSKEFLFRH